MTLPAQEDRLHELVEVFLEENSKLNLSAFRTPEMCWVGNVLDSIAILELMQSVLKVTSIPKPLPPEEEGTFEKEKRCKPRNTLFFAREMRKNPTQAEGLLWEAIRYDQLGARFRRQFIKDGAIFDFYCPSQSFAIEVDGKIHNAKKQREYDAQRDEFFRNEHDIRTLRFTNDEVLQSLHSVCGEIKKQIHPPPPMEEGLGVEVLDIGTGGGFPLLPLAICLPDANCTGMDATQKKIDSVQRMIDTLELKNVTLVCERTEELGKNPDHCEKYDLVTARAVAPLNVLIEYAAPFLKIGGHLIVWKSMNIDQELKDSLLARSELSCHLVKTHEYELPKEFGKRQLLVFEKAAKTPSKYPRGIGVAKKKPIS